MPGLNFKRAEREDAPLVISFIRELAEVEKFPDHVSVTTDALEENLFGENPAAEAVIMLWDDEPAGFAVYYETFATTTGKRGLHVDDLYVRPQFQSRGIGRQALRYLASLAQARGCGRFEWWSLRWNEQAIGFYESLGAQKMNELRVFRLDADGIRKLAGMGGV